MKDKFNMKFMESCKNPETAVAATVVIDFVERHTKLKHVSSPRQLNNCTLMFHDEEFNEDYALYLKSGYARRRVNGTFTKAWYQLNHKRLIEDLDLRWRGTPGSGRWIRILCPGDAYKLTQILVQAYQVRHKRCVMTNRGYAMTPEQIDRITRWN